MKRFSPPAKRHRLDFERAELRVELQARAHPVLREELYAFADWCEAEKVAAPYVVGLGRDAKENARVNGHPESWHLFDCAADLRSWIYGNADLGRVMTYWRGRQAALKADKGRRLELLHHDAGSGSHIHVAVRDAGWKATYAKEQSNG